MMNLTQLTVWAGQLLAQTEVAVPAPDAGPAAAPATGAVPDAAAAPINPMNNMLIMMMAVFGFMYFFMIRPQQKRDKERRDMLGALSKGDEVVTSGGICGSVVGLTENTVVLRVDDNTKIEFVRSAITQVTTQGEESKKSK